MKQPLTIFMFGYWGWGNATEKLVDAIDAVEKKRGFNPPFFVDIRMTRKVRAVGFHEDAFEKTVHKRRYCWMPELGNKSVVSDSWTKPIDINSPEAVEKLLNHALKLARRSKRIIFFCSCRHPRSPDVDCHRYTVAQLLIKAAKRRGISTEVVEWPGGEPSTVKIKVPSSEVPKDESSRLHLSSVRPLSKFAGLAVGSLVEVTSDKRERTVAVAPAMYAPSGWYLPILQNEQGKVIPGTTREANRWRKDCGYLPLRT